MNNKITNIEKVINHWITTADNDYSTMINLYNSKDYHWSLFIGHIVIERLLKAKYVEIHNEHAPLTHDLRKLSKLSNIELEQHHKDWLDTITAFNLNARYDSYKQAFYKKCTPEYTKLWIENIKKITKWIKERL